MRGAWVEMLAAQPAAHENVPSLPVRGAWVEMLRIRLVFRSRRSLPVRGAWVEIYDYLAGCDGAPCRSPCGERGLKWIARATISDAALVAPRAGSVG